MKKGIILLLFFLISIVPISVFADTIMFKNGDIQEGKVVYEDHKTVHLQFKNGNGTHRIPTFQVAFQAQIPRVLPASSRPRPDESDREAVSHRCPDTRSPQSIPGAHPRRPNQESRSVP